MTNPIAELVEVIKSVSEMRDFKPGSISRLRALLNHCEEALPALEAVLAQGWQDINVDDNFGSKQLLADIASQCHMIDIRVRLNGKYYWFEGDYLKHILKHIKYNQIDNDGIKATLEDHAEPT